MKLNRITKLGLVDGVTTNPCIIAKEGKDFEEVIKEICNIVDGSVSAEVIRLTTEEMVKEDHEFAAWAPNVVVKIPMTEAGLEAVCTLENGGIKTNVTLVFSAAQGLMAAKEGASFISPFVGRIDDIEEDGIELIQNLRKTLENYGLESKIITASIRTTGHLEQTALQAQINIATIPGSLLPKLWKHPLTDNRIEQFLKDWEKVAK